MAKWKRDEVPLAKGHKWRTRPGYSKLVLDRGRVNLDVPQDWVVEPGAEVSIQILDKPSPADDVRLEVSFNRLAPGVNWGRLPLEEIVSDLADNDGRNPVSRGPVKTLMRKGLRGAWVEIKFVDPVEEREAYSRMLVAVGGDVQVLLTCEYWPEDAGRARPAWTEALRTLELGLIIPDPSTGARVDPNKN